MDRIMQRDTAVLEQVRRIRPGECPDFYLKGNSRYELERLGLKIAEEVENRNLMQFKGIVRHFSLYLPYFNSENDARKFMEHLLESVSVARDCYDAYRGLVLLECSEEWSIYGFDPKLNALLNYMKVQTGICFIVLVPEQKNNRYGDVIFAEFTRCRIWMKIEVEPLDIRSCVFLFHSLAAEHDLKVSPSVAQRLADILTERRETDLDNACAVEQMVKQIHFNRRLTGSSKREIVMEDLTYLSGTGDRFDKRTIGFTADNR